MANKINKSVVIVAYKHDGSLHRTWRKGLILDANDDHIIVLNKDTLVTEASGRKWYTREPAVCIFYPNKWYNIICMIRKKGIYYYCNLASPALYEKGAIKYIDYELDVKKFPNGSFDILDKDEYQHAKLTMDYPEEIDKILWAELDELVAKIRKGEAPFTDEYVKDWYKRYQVMTNDSND